MICYQLKSPAFGLGVSAVVVAGVVGLASSF